MDGFKLLAAEVWQSFYLINKCTNNVWLQPEGLLLSSQVPATSHSPEADECSVHHPILFQIRFNIIPSGPWSSKRSLFPGAFIMKA
jgi:hypothetical protein